ncbi:hypothetical protein BP6252_02782 [Coleophoma cylindrospora]|uniref:Uncharacterized protein n=1 Tax=Coleophoma cylindrospora TaxID=1849047 RepID=A0A3D8SFV5_9HELO|nr:hypothetical protein BP6252_02782 [Coleophoma cylindrospora]
MFVRHIIVALASAVSLTHGSQPQKLLSLSNDNDRYGPSIDCAKKNANFIFNAVHSSMRQWGNSLHHNGLSLYPAIIPQGTLLYHGAPDAKTPPSFEWLAFEIEHAELFAVSWEEAGQGRPSRQSILLSNVEKSTADEAHTQEEWIFKPGYLQVYQANRPLRVLYIDGSSAAKAPYGTLDSQDLIVLDKPRSHREEMERAEDLCTLAAEWGIDGFIRMEAGFELINCNFSDGFDYLSHKKRPETDGVRRREDVFFAEYMRDVASRYHGIGARRVLLDYSSMTSVFFYPANLSSEESGDYDLSLPRVMNTEHDQLLRIRSDLKESIFRQASVHDSIDWQGVVDMIVSRFADRLTLLEADLSYSILTLEIDNLLNMYIDFSETLPNITESTESCSLHYLQPVEPSTAQDHLLYAAIKTATHKICTTLFQAREHLLGCTSACEDSSVVPGMIRELKEWLNWTTWKECQSCPQDTFCYIATYPWGFSKDHYNPSCLNQTELGIRGRVRGYWIW